MQGSSPDSSASGDEFELSLDKALLADEQKLKPGLKKILLEIGRRGRPLKRKGLFSQVAEESGVEVTLRRRHMLHLFGMLGVAAVRAHPVAATVSIVPAVTAGLEQIRKVHEDNVKRFTVSPAFAAHVAGRNYSDANLPNGYDRSKMTLADEAVVQSNNALRAGDIDALDDIHTTLERALEYTESEDARAIVLSRLMIDNSFIGNAEKASGYLSRVEFSKLIDRRVVMRILDFGTSVAMNSMTEDEFERLSSPMLAHLERGWLRLGINTPQPSEYAALFSEFGVGIYSFIQRASVARVSRATTAASQSTAREIWFAGLREAAMQLRAVPDPVGVAEDFLYSMHRPTFHAAAAGDLDQARTFLDYYFGRRRPAQGEEHIQRARDRIATGKLGSSPWMSLLDISMHSRPSSYREAYEALIASDYHPSGRALMRAVIEVGVNAGHLREDLEKQFGADRVRLEVPDHDLHQVYTQQVSTMRHEATNASLAR